MKKESALQNKSEQPFGVGSNDKNILHMFVSTLDGCIASAWMIFYLLIAGIKPGLAGMPWLSMFPSLMACLLMPVLIAVTQIWHRVGINSGTKFHAFAAISTSAIAISPFFFG